MGRLREDILNWKVETRHDKARHGMAGLPNRREDSLIDDLATLQPPNERLPYRLAGDTSRCSRPTMISH